MYKHIVKPLLFSRDTEETHERTLNFAAKVNHSAFLQRIGRIFWGGSDLQLSRQLMGLDFPNPIGLAAGFDKNGYTVNAMAAVGFGFIEVGSITALASDGNPKPRLFRLPEDESVINRMGLNNEGAERIVNRIKNTVSDIPVGINIAKTNDKTITGDSAISDYLKSYTLAKEHADYVTVNISCPNTEEGKTFEEPGALRELLSALNPGNESCPTLVKFSVDLENEELKTLTEICEDFGISGYVATNTSSKRDNLKTFGPKIDAIGRGGLSGAAIAIRSTEIVGELFSILQGSKPIIGVGGINSPVQALAKFNAGADLIQLYTGLIYEGPSLVKRIKREIRKQL